jgi:hypothetical protein
MPEDETIERIHCNDCRQETRHRVLVTTVDNETEYTDVDNLSIGRSPSKHLNVLDAVPSSYVAL